MKTMKLMSFAMAVLFALLLSNPVQAQKSAVVTFEGIEVSSANKNPSDAYGWMSYAKTTGNFQGNFTLSTDYLGIKTPGTSTDVTGGTWTLPVYGTSKVSVSIKQPIPYDPYQGVLFGSVDAGSVTWDKTGATATVELEMSIRGGTLVMANYAGTAILYGTITYDEKGGSGTFEGTIYFEFE